MRYRWPLRWVGFTYETARLASAPPDRLREFVHCDKCKLMVSWGHAQMVYSYDGKEGQVFFCPQHRVKWTRRAFYWPDNTKATYTRIVNCDETGAPLPGEPD